MQVVFRVKLGPFEEVTLLPKEAKVWSAAAPNGHNLHSDERKKLQGWCEEVAT